MCLPSPQVKNHFIGQSMYMTEEKYTNIPKSEKIKLLVISYVPEIAIGNNMKVIADEVAKAFMDAGQKYNRDFDLTIIYKIDRNQVIKSLKDIAKYLESPDRKAIVYYFGHGNQIRDMNGDEPDGRDEIWQTQNIVDDEITLVFSNINITSYLFLFSDSCSSGSMIDDNNKQNWATISSSNDVQDSLAMTDGGVFTMYGLIPALDQLKIITPKTVHDYIAKTIDIPTQTSILRTGRSNVENIGLFD